MRFTDPKDPTYRFWKEKHSRRQFISSMGIDMTGPTLKAERRSGFNG